MTHVLTSLRPLLVAAGCSILLIACGGGNDDNLDDRADLADPKVRFVQATPALPDVTLRRDGKAESAATDVGYLFGSQYDDIGRGSTAFELRLDTLGTQIASTSIDAERGTKYTLVAVPDGTDADFTVIEDPFNKSVASDNAHVRVFNAASNADDVDVYLTQRGVDIADVKPSFASVDYKASQPKSGSDSIDFERGTYALRITRAGSKTVIFESDVDVPKNADWLLVVVPIDDLTPPDDAIRVLRVRADDSDDATDVLDSNG